MDEIAEKRVDRLCAWIKANRKDLLRNGEVSPVELASATEKKYTYWSDVLGKRNKSFGATAARQTEEKLGMPHLHLEGASWPFPDIDYRRWNGLTERQKGRVERAVLEEIEKIEAEAKLKTGTGS